MADAGKLLQLRHVSRHLTAVVVHECLREPLEVLRLGRRQTARPDERQDLRLRQPGHGLGRRGTGEEGGRDEVDARVGRLCGEGHGDEQRERIGVAEGDGRMGIELVEDLSDLLRLLRPLHSVTSIQRAISGGRGGEATPALPSASSTSAVGTGPAFVRRRVRTMSRAPILPSPRSKRCSM